MSERDPFFRHYFSRIDPAVAASFTPEQRRAMKVMFGARSQNRHPFDIRKSFSLFRKRYYFVILGGVERRSKERLRREGMLSGTLDAIATLVGVVFVMVPILAALYLFKSAVGLDLLATDGVHGLMDRVSEQLDTALR